MKYSILVILFLSLLSFGCQKETPVLHTEPGSPVGLIGLACKGIVHLSWDVSLPSDSVSSYMIYAYSLGRTPIFIKSVKPLLGSNLAEIPDVNLFPSGTNDYTVTAINKFGTSVMCSPVGVFHIDCNDDPNEAPPEPH